jgi:hypothetical protein
MTKAMEKPPEPKVRAPVLDPTYEGGSAYQEAEIAAATLQLIYKRCVRKAWQPIHGQKYQAKAVDVELNLAETKEPDQWVKIRLLFVRGNAGDSQQTTGKHDWAVFLTTDTTLSETEILELYAMRWAIEIDQPCCLHKSVLRKLLYRFCDGFYPGTINSPQFT